MDDRTRNLIFEQNEKLIHTSLKSYRNNIKNIEQQAGLTYDDLYQECAIYFLKLIDRFDAKKAKFSTYVISSLKLYINVVILKHSTLFQVPHEIKRAYFKMAKFDCFHQDTTSIMTDLNLSKHAVNQAKTFHAMHSSLDATLINEYEDQEGSFLSFLRTDDFSNQIDTKLFFESLAQKTLSDRQTKAWRLYHHYGYTQKEIASFFKVSKTTIDHDLKNTQKKARQFFYQDILAFA